MEFHKKHRTIFIETVKPLGKIELYSPTHGEECDLFQLKPYVTVGNAFKSLPFIGTCNREKTKRFQQ